MTIRSKRVSGKQAIHYRNYRRVRDRALSRLSQAYPETYKELLEQEKAIDEAQGRKWIDIDGNTNKLDTRADATASAKAQGSNRAEDEGDNGGEA